MPVEIPGAPKKGEILEKGERPCQKCGKPHSARVISVGALSAMPTVTWEDPEDGHDYYPESWEQIAKRLSEQSGIPILKET